MSSTRSIIPITSATIRSSSTVVRRLLRWRPSRLSWGAIPGRPTQTFAKDQVLKLGGAEVQLHFYGRGHTGDDTMVYFPDAKVVMVSDQITNATPIVDFANGGSAVEWTQILDGVLKLDFESAIPGRGEPKTRAEVQAYRTNFSTLISRATDAIKGGATR